MNTVRSDSQSSSEDGIRRVSEDPELTSDGLCGLGEEYTPPPAAKQSLLDAQVMGSQDVYDADNEGYHTIARRG